MMMMCQALLKSINQKQLVALKGLCGIAWSLLNWNMGAPQALHLNKQATQRDSALKNWIGIHYHNSKMQPTKYQCYQLFDSVLPELFLKLEGQKWNFGITKSF